MTHTGKEETFCPIGFFGAFFRQRQFLLGCFQFTNGVFQLLTLLDGIFKGGKKKINNLHAIGGNNMFFTPEVYLKTPPGGNGFTKFLVDEDALDARNQKVVFVRFRNKVIRSAFQSSDDIDGIGEGCQEHERRFFEAVLPLDSFAQLKAVHLRHDHIADHEIRNLFFKKRQRLYPVTDHGSPVPVLLQKILQANGLGQAVFNHQDFDLFLHNRPFLLEKMLI